MKLQSMPGTDHDFPFLLPLDLPIHLAIGCQCARYLAAAKWSELVRAQVGQRVELTCDIEHPYLAATHLNNSMGTFWEVNGSCDSVFSGLFYLSSPCLLEVLTVAMCIDPEEAHGIFPIIFRRMYRVYGNW